jgi:hypothetical protein
MSAGDSSASVAREQLYVHVVYRAKREHAGMEDSFLCGSCHVIKEAPVFQLRLNPLPASLSGLTST